MSSEHCGASAQYRAPRLVAPAVLAVATIPGDGGVRRPTWRVQVGVGAEV